MEESHRSETTELRGSKSDTSALTAGRERGFTSFPATLNDNTKWTDEKHRAYLNHLESSFVKELHHSINLLPRGKGQNHNGSMSEMELIDAHYTSKQFSDMHYGNWQMDDVRGEGSGQNFVDEDTHNTRNTRSRLRRMR